MGIAIDIDEAVRVFPVGGCPIVALDRVSLEVEDGDFIAVGGRSGSGKTTLLHLLAGVDRVTTGRVRVRGTDLGALSESALARWRGRNVGVVFQFSQLIPNLSVLENVLLPMELAGSVDVRARRRLASKLLERVGIADQANRFPGLLSGGQQQRAAIARALANDPPVILADQPTDNLDALTSQQILDLFLDLNYDGRTIVMVSHEVDIRATVKREITLAQGRLVADERLVPVH